MQNIKFRAKDLSGKWIYGSLVKEEKLYSQTDYVGKFADFYYIYTKNEKDWTAPYHNIPVCKGTIGQFIGIPDIHQTDIYVGDILKDRTYGGLYEVVFDEKRAMFCFRQFTGTDDTYEYTNWSCDAFDGTFQLEIIGNIWDDPQKFLGVIE